MEPVARVQEGEPGLQELLRLQHGQALRRDTNIIEKGKTTYKLKEKDCPPGTLVKLCFSSDFFLEEADEWREGCWDAIRSHPDCTFVLTTKTLRVEACCSSAPSRSSASWRPCTPRSSPPAASGLVKKHGKLRHRVAPELVCVARKSLLAGLGARVGLANRFFSQDPPFCLAAF